MADIVTEIDTIGDLIELVASFTRYYKQSFPTRRSSDLFAIRWQGDNTPTELSGVVYETARPYQVTYFGNSEIDCMQKADAIQTELRKHIKVRLRGLNEYITFGPFAFSAPYKTDTDGVYAVVGILLVHDYVERPQPEWQKMRRIEAEITENGGGN